MAFLVFGIAASGLLLVGAVRLLGSRLQKAAESQTGVGEPTLGLAAALVADSPELATAAVALIEGRGGISQGVLIGACALNLAGVVGVGCLLYPTRAKRGWASYGMPAFLGLGSCLAGGTAPGFSLAALGLGAVVLQARGSIQKAAVRRPVRPPFAVLGALLVLVAASWALVGLVAAAGRHLGLAGSVAGVALLAPITAAPNIYAGLLLVRSGRWQAATAECFASNAINLLLGLFPVAAASGAPVGAQPLVALAIATALALVVTGWGRGGAWPLVGACVATLAVAAAR